MADPLVSIVMPCFNSMKHISDSIDSILQQTYTNWELIIVDGHSSDETLEIIKSYQDKDERIKLVFDNGQGIGAASKIGCDNCRGEYIARMDSDDISQVNRLELELRYLKKHPNTVMVASTAIYIDENGKTIGLGIPYRYNYGSQFFKKGIFHPSIMMRASAYVKAGGYYPVKHAEDLFLWYRLQRLGDIKVLNIPLIKYRISEGALSSFINLFLINNIHYLWYFYSKKEIISDDDIGYINRLIAANKTTVQQKRNPINVWENKMQSLLLNITHINTASKILCVIKDVYGIFKVVI